MESPTAADAPDLRQLLRARAEEDGNSEERRPAVIITVLKEYRQLEKLADCLQVALEGGIPGLPVGPVSLIIDDEGDQATPNVAPPTNKKATSTYRSLAAVREELARHTLIQYTATPQALLLMSTDDPLSPEFVWQLEPGPGYTGGRYFFLDHRSDFVKHIPQLDLDLCAEGEHEYPDSLYAALASFCLLLARGQIVGDDSRHSMLINPGQAKIQHSWFSHPVNAALSNWEEVLRAQRDSGAGFEKPGTECKDLIERLFRPAYEDLVSTMPDLPSLEELLDALPIALLEVKVHVVNSERDKDVPWHKHWAWVIIGGNMLSRGFTVNGLRTTYMPRGKGIAADTLQQRARFFGYRDKYAAQCRGWLPTDVAELYEQTVELEEELRKSLIPAMSGEQSLREWRRALYLDPRLAPTRKAVIRMDLSKVDFGGGKNEKGWCVQRYASPDSGAVRHLWSLDDRAVATNENSCDQFAQSLSWEDAFQYEGWGEDQRHESALASIPQVVDLLSSLTLAHADSTRFAALNLLLVRVLEEGLGTEVRVLRMGAGSSKGRRSRTVGESGQTPLLQGRNPNSNSDAYPGDAALQQRDFATLQLHPVTLLPSGLNTHMVAMNLPKSFRRPVLMQT